MFLPKKINLARYFVGEGVKPVLCEKSIESLIAILGILIISRHNTKGWAIQKTDKIFEQIILNVPNLIFWKNIHVVYEGCNYNFSKLFGFNHPKQLIGKTDHVLPLATELADDFKQEDAQIIAEGTSVLQKKINLQVAGQNELSVLANKIPLRDADGNIFGVFRYLY